MSALAVVTKPADQSTDDLALVAAVRAGDDRAYELLFVRYQARIAAYVRGMVRDHGRAEDITQEVFISALRRLRQTDSPIAFKPWIYEIAKNACIDAFRRSRNANEVSFDADDGLGPSMVDRGGAPDAIVDAKLAIDDLCGAFGGLSQTHHDILVMREFEGLTYSEIGERLGLSHAAVESTLFRARRRLTEEYEELVSGERCRRVRGIVDAPAGRAVGVRDQRRMARHIAHCQPCRRYARLSGVDLDVKRSASAATRIAALLPLPTFLRRRFDVDDANQFLGHHSPPMLQWSTKVVAVLDPATVSGWPKAIATAATVAVAGLGAGAAVGERDTLKDLVTRAPSIGTAGHAPAAQSRDRGRASVRSHMARSRGAAASRDSGQRAAADGTDPSSATGHPPAKSGARTERPHTGGSPASEPARGSAGAAPAAGDPPKRPCVTLPDTSLPAVQSQLDDAAPQVPSPAPRDRVARRAGQGRHRSTAAAQAARAPSARPSTRSAKRSRKVARRAPAPAVPPRTPSPRRPAKAVRFRPAGLSRSCWARCSAAGARARIDRRRRRARPRVVHGYGAVCARRVLRRSPSRAHGRRRPPSAAHRGHGGQALRRQAGRDARIRPADAHHGPRRAVLQGGRGLRVR